MSILRRRTARGWHYDGSEPVIHPGGKKGCRWCRGPIPPPKRSFCSAACVHEWKLRSDPGYVRDCLRERDQAVCAACGFDCAKARRCYEQLREAARPKHRKRIGAAAHRERAAEFQRHGETLPPEILRRARRGQSWWDADHTLPVIEGGGECGLENYRTLCATCHHAATLALRRRRRLERNASQHPA